MKTTANAPGHPSLEPPAGPPPPTGPTAPQTTRARVAARARPIGRWLLRAGKRIAAVLLAILLVTAVATVWGTAKSPVSRPLPPATINDVTRLNPIVVAGVIQ